MEPPMKPDFSIDFNWLSRECEDPVVRATFAEISIIANGWTATELEDLSAKTVRSGARVSAYTLALWFAANWWRLRWEPERTTLSWKMSHHIGAAGEGYLWPDLFFSSDGESIRVHTRSSRPTSEQMVRYLNNVDVPVSAAIFEQSIDTFIEAVVNRLAGESAHTVQLCALWKEVLEERYTPELASWRKLEALMGFDPGEATDSLVNEMLEVGRDLGVCAVEEMASVSAGNALADIHALWDQPRRSAIPVKTPEFDNLRSRLHNEISFTQYPWKRAELTARMAREEWSISPGPLPTKDLADLLEVGSDLLTKSSATTGPIHAGFRTGTNGKFSVFLNSPFQENRRFALMRLVGDHLSAPESDRLLPAAPGGIVTHRQKFQRAFAQEFLCPYRDLADYLGTDEPDDEAIDSAGRHFGVSPLLVRTTLVNKGIMERSILSSYSA
jgi:hypothetical protein